MKLLSGCTLVLVSSLCFAVEPAEIPLFGFYVTPIVEVEEQYISNLLYKPHNTTDTWKTTVAPSISAVAEYGVGAVLLNYSHELGFHSDSGDDDYSDGAFSILSKLSLSHRSQLEMSLKYSNSHQSRGTGFTEGQNISVVDTPIEYDELDVYGGFTFGSSTSRGRVQLGIGMTDLEYTNYDFITGDNNYVETKVWAEFSARVASRTSFVVDATVSDYDYEADNETMDTRESLDRTSNKILSGLSWGYSGSTRGTIKLGARQVRFEDSTRKSFTGPSGEVVFDWQPSSLTQLQMTAGQEEREPYGEEGFIISSELNMILKRKLAERMQASIDVLIDDLDFVRHPAGRSDQVNSIDLSLGYNARRWLDVVLRLNYRKSSSTINLFEFERGEVGLSIEASL